jgi:arginyl-tRNA synthetase
VQTLRSELRLRLEQALASAGLPIEAAAISPATDARFGDYQSNVAMTLAKSQKMNPRAVAETIRQHLAVDDLCSSVEIAGAGFLNFRLADPALAARVAQLASDSRLGVEPLHQTQRIVVDFSSPNVAKPMHVGHVRSTILGDSLTRIARFLGHEVITDNHLGDWGTQFGKIIYGWKHLLDRSALASNPIVELLRLYREVNSREANDPELARAVREELVALQSGDEENLAIWRETVELSWREFARLYQLLDVHFDHHLGESFYNPALAPLVDRLLAEGIAEISDGAVCIFFRDLPELADKPCLIRKSDGGFLYATTDLATLEYRRDTWQPDAVWYVTGAPQTLHFQQVFAAARRMGCHLDSRHIAFGSILGEDRKIMKTRSGDNIGLAEVLHEAIERARALIVERNPTLPAEELEKISHEIGLGAVKYAELSQHRLSDYVFSWDKFLSFQGNTAPYLQNAHVRIRSIFRKLETPWSPEGISPALNEPSERALALQLMRFGEILPEVLEDFRPNLLANYLYELANGFHAFYEHCPVLKAEESIRQSRLLLCELTSRVLRQGLELLGIRCPERM